MERGIVSRHLLPGRAARSEPDGKPAVGRAGNDAGLDVMDLYRKDIGRGPRLTAEEEKALGRAVQAGIHAKKQLSQDGLDNLTRGTLSVDVERGDRARGRMVETNLSLVIAVAKSFQGRGLPLVDLVQEGNIGLCRAVEGFDPERGTRFSTYAVFWIWQAVDRAIKDTGHTVRIPVHKHDELRKFFKEREKQREKFIQERGREPTEEELIDALSLTFGSKEKAQSIADLHNSGIADSYSLNRPVGEDGKELGDFVASPVNVEEQVVNTVGNKTAAGEAFRGLSARERRVLELRFGINTDQGPLTLAEVGQELGVSRERVRQIEAGALGRLRELRNDNPVLKEFEPETITPKPAVDLRAEPRLGEPHGGIGWYTNGPIVIIKPESLTDRPVSANISQLSKPMPAERPSKLELVRTASERLSQVGAFLRKGKDVEPDYVGGLGGERLLSTMAAFGKAAAQKDRVLSRLNAIEKKFGEASRAIGQFEESVASGLWSDATLSRAQKVVKEKIIFALRKQPRPEPAPVAPPAAPPPAPPRGAPLAGRIGSSFEPLSDAERRELEQPASSRGKRAKFPREHSEEKERRKRQTITITLPNGSQIQVGPKVGSVIEGLLVGSPEKPVTTMELLQAAYSDEINAGKTTGEILLAIHVMMGKARGILGREGYRVVTVSKLPRVKGSFAAYYVREKGERDDGVVSEPEDVKKN